MQRQVRRLSDPLDDEGAVRIADSDQFARLFRSHLAQDSEMISPRVPISNRPGTRFFQHVSFWHR
jgi:hypothetical protein